MSARLPTSRVAVKSQLDVPFANLYFGAADAVDDPAAVPLAHLADYQKVDRLLDAAEQSVRQSFESAAELAVDRHLRAVCNLVACWSIGSARDLAWNNCLLMWQVREDEIAYGLLCDSLAAAAALASRMLLAAV
jgi:hypothetical protein